MELEARLKRVRLCLLSDIAIHKTLVSEFNHSVALREFFLDTEGYYDDTIARLQSLVSEYVSLIGDIERMKEYDQTLDNTFSNLILVAPFSRSLTKLMESIHNATRSTQEESKQYS